MAKELCIRCGRPTPYDINTPIHLRRYFVEGSGQLCEQCFSQLYPSATDTDLYNTTSPGEKENQTTEPPETLPTITLPTPTPPTLPDQEKYKELIKKEKLTDEDREVLAALYKKYATS